MIRRGRYKSTIRLGISAVGSLMILAALGAGLLGVDQDAGWGPARLFLLYIGITLALTPYLSSIVRWIWGHDCLRPLTALLVRMEDSNFVSGFQKWLTGIFVTGEDSFEITRRKKRIDVFLSITMLLTTGVLTWIVSVGTWFDWPDTTDYFHLQAQAFSSGQMHLLVEPSDQILFLEDPYIFEERAELPFLWDASLFDGKYYLYWGPIPGLMTALLESLLKTDIGDQYLVYFFTIGAIAFSLLTLRLIWNAYFPTLAAWTILPAALLMCFGNPVPWLLGRPAVYEAAIASGQFFFMGGIFWFLLGLRPGIRRILHISLSGLFFIGALGSRITLLFGILLLSIVGGVLALKEDHDIGKALISYFRRYLIFIVLVVLGLLILAWYNYARFGNIFEFGHRYQLSYWGKENPYEDLISWRNIIPNLYNYFLNSYRTLNVFPFIKPLWGKSGVSALRATAGATYRPEQVTGILITSPLVIIGCIPIYYALCRVWTRLDEPITSRGIKNLKLKFSDVNLIYTGILVITCALLLPLTLISFNSMRYLFDFSLSASIMAAIGIGLTLQSNHISSVLKGLIGFMVILFSLYTSLVGILLGITSYHARFENLNPELFDQITRFFAF